MEKLSPTHSLQDIKEAFDEAYKIKMNRKAFNDATALLRDLGEVVECIQSIKPAHFYKSMTSDRNHRVWQDVYHVPWDGTELYVKFTRVGERFKVLSLKEK